MSAHVLIIDDDRDIRDLLALYLRSRSYRVDTAGDGVGGLAACREAVPDLVMCDLRMPGLDGLSVLSHLSRDFPELPVIIVSGTADVGDAIQALRLGAWDYVTKPILDLAVLDHALARALERARLLAENRAYRERLEAANAQLEQSLRQLEADEAAGRRIQFTLLPRRRVGFGALECSRFLKTSSFLSGDFSDYFTIDERRFGFYIADVSGHGVSSAVITVMLKSMVGRHLENHRHYGVKIILQPAELLGDLNRQLLEGSHGKYLTMFYGVIDLGGMSMCCANGGQFPFPLLFDGRDTRWLGGRSAPVGLFDDAEYREETVPVGGRFALTLFSDGVLEMLPEQDLESRKARLCRAASASSQDAAAMARSLGIEDDSVAPDDASILVVRRVPDDA